MKTVRRSLSPFRRRRTAKELIQAIQVKESEHLRTIELVVSEESRSLNAKRPGSLVPKTNNPDETQTTKPGKWFSKSNKKDEIKRGRSQAPVQEEQGTLLNDSPEAPSSTTLQEFNIPMVRKASLDNDAVLEVANALRHVENQIRVASRQGKRVSRGKVMEALQAILDHLDTELQPLTQPGNNPLFVVQYVPPVSSTEKDDSSDEETQDDASEEQTESYSSVETTDTDFDDDGSRDSIWRDRQITSTFSAVENSLSDLFYPATSNRSSSPPPPPPKSWYFGNCGVVNPT